MCIRDRFTDVYIADFRQENVDSCKNRLNKINVEPRVFCGKAEKIVNDVCSILDKRALHLAFLDPFSLHALPFSIIQSLSTRRKIDILIHFSVMDFARNYARLLDQNLIDTYIPGAQSAYDPSRNLRSNRKNAFQLWYCLLYTSRCV